MRLSALLAVALALPAAAVSFDVGCQWGYYDVTAGSFWGPAPPKIARPHFEPSYRPVRLPDSYG